MNLFNTSDLFTKLKEAVEIVKPNLRHYYRVLRKGRVETVYTTTADGYYIDVQPLNNDETIDGNEPLLPQIAVPQIWAGNDKGIICPPEVGMLCDIDYYDGDPNYPRISNFHWNDSKVPDGVEQGELLFQKSVSNYKKWNNAGGREEEIPGNVEKTVGGSIIETVIGTVSKTIGGLLTIVGKGEKKTFSADSTIEAGGTITRKAGAIDIDSDSVASISGAGQLNLSGGSFNATSDASMSIAAGGKLSISASSMEQSFSNAGMPVDPDALRTTLVAGNYHLLVTAGNYISTLTAGVYMIGNATGTLGQRLLAGIDIQIQGLTTQNKTLTSIQAMIFPTPNGPTTGPPTNAADFVAQAAEVQVALTALNAEKTMILGLFL